MKITKIDKENNITIYDIKPEEIEQFLEVNYRLSYINNYADIMKRNLTRKVSLN